MRQGVNLIGYSRAELGLGESCRNAAMALERTGIPFGIINYSNCVQRQEDLSWAHKEITQPYFNTNIIHLNADIIQDLLLRFYKMKLSQGRYNVGYWHWELPEFPKEDEYSFNFVDEVWVPSSFVEESISRNSPVPVIRIPHAIEIYPSKTLNRDYFHLPNDAFIFLTMFDMHSRKERKNPAGTIEAFLKAFHSQSSRAILVIKINAAGHSGEELDQLKELAAQHSNILLLDQILSRIEVVSLLNCADSLISLHRSEGFGLPLAEAMYLGKPVIGTNWSGNIDFMNSSNSFPIDYQLITIKENHGPYKPGQKWADPDLEHASFYIKKVAGNDSFVKEKGKRGQQTIKQHYSPEAVGALKKTRLQMLGLI